MPVSSLDHLKATSCVYCAPVKPKSRGTSVRRDKPSILQLVSVIGAAKFAPKIEANRAVVGKNTSRRIELQSRAGLASQFWS